MKTGSLATDDAILVEIGARFARARLERNWTQAELADQAGVSKRTIERLERGQVGVQLSSFIRVCRALNLLEGLNRLIPEPLPDPLAQLKLKSRERRRASSPGQVRARSGSGKPWTWGDDQ